ncbi:MAG: integrase core domain-containing protein [Chitinophagaceae bacterium]
MDNGPEFIAKLASEFSQMYDIEFKYIEPANPLRTRLLSDSIEAIEAILDAHLFKDIEEVREVTEEWISDYNQHRPHDALGVWPSAVSKKMKEIKHLPLGLRSASAPLRFTTPQKT